MQKPGGLSPVLLTVSEIGGGNADLLGKLTIVIRGT